MGNPRRKKQRGKKLRATNLPSKFPLGEIPKQGPLREVHPTLISVNNEASLLELQRIGEPFEI